MKNYQVPLPVALTTIAGLLVGVGVGFFAATKVQQVPPRGAGASAQPAQASSPGPVPGDDSPVPVPRGEYRAKGPATTPAHFRGTYLDLLKMALTDLLYENDAAVIEKRQTGRDWPGRAVTMIGLKRLDNVHMCAETVLKDRVPGDFIEAGVWRGGTTILMKAILKEYGDTSRTVWVADSFEGVPPPNLAKYPQDKWVDLYAAKPLAISVPAVRANFERFGLLDDRVRFLRGWFKDTLGKAPIGKLALLRLDGDLYESTMDTLVPLYPKLSPGGYCIVDDYYGIPAQKKAVDEYRREHGITEEIHPIDWAGAFWRKRK